MNLKFLCICSPSTSTFFDQTTQTPPKGSEISVSNAPSDSPQSIVPLRTIVSQKKKKRQTVTLSSSKKAKNKTNDSFYKGRAVRQVHIRLLEFTAQRLATSHLPFQLC